MKTRQSKLKIGIMLGLSGLFLLLSQTAHGEFSDMYEVDIVENPTIDSSTIDNVGWNGISNVAGRVNY